ncbi:hypothetical protein [Vagococcus carniphilus]|nr:hypothetical protein [Vagococcus carniphilus]MDT2813290.1 hypothetical protein [Vagococcus carniphilus]
MFQQIEEISIPAFANSLAINGNTCMLATFNKTENFEERIHLINFEQQQVIMLDFDNSIKDIERHGVTSFESIRNHLFIQSHASFMYRTFSDKESEYDKFRVVFVLDKSEDDYLLIENIYKKLFRMFPTADKKCSNPNRLFFGTTSGFTKINFSNVLTTSEFTSDIVLLKSAKVTTLNKISKVVAQNSTEIINRKRVWELIKENTIESNEAAREIIMKKFDKEISRVFPSYTNARVVLRQSIDIREFLELPDGEPFTDILEKDDKPSASVIQWSDGTQIYHRFNTSTFANLDIIRVIAMLINESGAKAHYHAIDLIMYLTNSKLDRNCKASEQIDDINYLRRVLKDKKFDTEYPKFSKFIGNDLLIAISLLDMMTDYIYEDFETGEIRHLLCLTSKNIASEINRLLKTKYDSKRIQRVINKLAITENIEKLEQANIPTYLYTCYTETFTDKIAKKQRHHTNFLEIKNVDLNNSEKISTDLYDNNFTLSSLNFEGISRIIGLEKANKIFNQRETTVISQKINVDEDLLSKNLKDTEQKIAKYMLTKIEKQNYVSEKEIIFYITRYLKKKTKLDAGDLIKQCRMNICNTYDLLLINVNKENREMYNISEDIVRQSIVYVRNN